METEYTTDIVLSIMNSVHVVTISFLKMGFNIIHNYHRHEHN
jgi:hypothetical protein